MSDPGTAMMVLQAAALLYVAYRLSQTKSPNIKQDSPVPNATRGHFCSYLMGHGRTEMTHNWVSKPAKTSEDGEGGKGGKKPQVTVYNASAMHVLGVGPAWQMKGIKESGHYIYSLPINRESHPSGSVIPVLGHGSFAIYWGEPDQPINTILGEPDKVGIASRWPYLFYIHWITKRLGTTPVWNSLDYEWEKRNEQTHLAMTPAYLPNEYNIVKTSDGSGVTTTFSWFIVENVAGPPGTNYFRVRRDPGNLLPTGDHTNEMPPNSVVKISDQPSPTPFKTGEYPVLYSKYNPGVPGDPLPGNSMDIYLGINVDQVSTTGATYKGGLQGVAIVETDTLDLFPDGMNPIHMIAGMLFDQWPHGMRRNKARYDMTSFEEAAQVCDDERIPGRILGEDGEQADAMIAGILQDVGMAMALDPITGKLRIVPMREAPLNVTEIPLDALLEPLPVIERLHGRRAADGVAFTYPDRKQAYKSMQVAVDDDGHASQEENQRRRRVTMTIPIDFVVAAMIAERRAPEALAGSAKIDVFANREAPLLQPGMPYRVAGTPFGLRINSVTHDVLTSRTKVVSLKDVYGSPISVNKPLFAGPVAEPFVPPGPDIAYMILEVPAHLSPDGNVRIVIPRIRASQSITHAKFWLSADGSSYQSVGEDFSLCAGGVLTQPLSVSSLMLLEDGPSFDALGPDIDMVQDLTGDEQAWRLGRQILVFEDLGPDPMVCHLRNITAMGGGSWQLNGLMQARYATPKKGYVAGTRFFIFQADAITFISDALLFPNQHLFAKSQPYSMGGGISLAQIVAEERDLIGKGVVPMPMANLRTMNGANYYRTGQNVPLGWNYRSAVIPKTGWGLQGYGVAKGSSPVQGTFTVRILNNFDIVKRTVTGLTVPRYTYSNADMLTDFASVEPAAFHVEVENVYGGHASPTLFLTVVKV